MASEGVDKIVVPANRSDIIPEIRSAVEQELGTGNYEMYATGFGERQGGVIEDFANVAKGVPWHVFLGSEIYKDGPEKYRENAEKYAEIIESINTQESKIKND